MARVRSPNSIEAEQLYHEGMKLVDIAKKFGVPASTVRRWKSTQKWDDNKPDQSKKNKTNARIIRIVTKRTLGNQEERPKEIKMLLAMPLLYLNAIRMLRSMEHILQFIGIHWMKMKYILCRRYRTMKKSCYSSRLRCIPYGNVNLCIRSKALKKNQKRDCM